MFQAQHAANPNINWNILSPDKPSHSRIWQKDLPQPLGPTALWWCGEKSKISQVKETELNSIQQEPDLSNQKLIQLQAKVRITNIPDPQKQPAIT